MKIAFCIRGHIRDGLTDSRLKDYVSILEGHGHTVDLFLHTWNVSEAQSSYRKLNTTNVTVICSVLKDYFSKYNIKQIIVDDDSKCQLHGSLEGKIHTCPRIAWKRMWAGKFKLVSYLYDNHRHDYDLVVNTRYDKFTTKVCYTPVKNLLKMTTAGEGLSLKYPHQYRHIKGIDNYYCGSLQAVYDITHAFHCSLDEIALKYSIRSFHEELFYKYAVEHNLIR